MIQIKIDKKLNKNGDRRGISPNSRKNLEKGREAMTQVKLENNLNRSGNRRGMFPNSRKNLDRGRKYNKHTKKD